MYIYLGVTKKTSPLDQQFQFMDISGDIESPCY